MVRVWLEATQDNKGEREKKHTFICQNKRDSHPNIWQAADPPLLRPQRVELIA